MALHNNDQDVIATLIKVLYQNGKNVVPDIYQGSSLPTPQRPGFLARLFDRTAVARDDYAHKQLLVILETELKALEIEAEGYVDTARLSTESRVRVHEHKVAQQEALVKKEVEGQAQIDLHVMQQRLIERVAELGLDPLDEQYLVQKIVTITMGNHKDKENNNGHK